MIKRRTFLFNAGAFGAIAGAGLLTPQALWAAAYPTEAFEADTLDGAMSALQVGDAQDSDQITLKAPDIAENGAVVPISVSADIDNVETISIVVEGNPNPLAAQFDVSQGGLPDVSTRIKMGKTSNVVALVKADGKVYRTSKEVKVTIGGCGG